MLGGSIEKEFGEIPLEGRALHSQTLKVYAMKSPSGENFIGVSLVAKAPLAASMTPFKLSRAQAQELATLLSRASGFHGAASLHARADRGLTDPRGQRPTTVPVPC